MCHVTWIDRARGVSMRDSFRTPSRLGVTNCNRMLLAREASAVYLLRPTKKAPERPALSSRTLKSRSSFSYSTPPSHTPDHRLSHISTCSTKGGASSSSSSSSVSPKVHPGQQLPSPIADYLSALNDEQQQAVHSTNSVVRVKAGPGSGKTRVVTARVANLLSKGEPTYSILVITFTNKAASELKERLQNILGDTRGTTGVSAGTFHSIGARILRKFIEELPSSSTAGTGLRKLCHLNLTKSFVILDADDSKRAMRKVVESFIQGPVPKTQSAKLAGVLTEIYSKIRSQFATVHNGFSWTKAMAKMDLSQYTDQILPFREAELPECFDMYDRECRENNAVDFDDLLSLTVALLQQVQGVRQQLHELWKHVLVDEFQDTNAAQYEIVRLLRGPDDARCFTFVVGDSDQAIYSWRGANPDNMDIEFERDFPSCATLFLSRNYRSSSGIVDTAEAVLSHQGLPHMHQRTVPMKQEEGHVQSVVTSSERHEPFWVTNKIRELTVTGGSGYKDIAIIYRIRTQSRLFQEALAGAGIPFTVLGEKPFWSRSEIKVMTCYLRLTANPATDTMALDEVINMPSRKIGPKSIDKMLEVAAGQSIGLASLLFGDLESIAPLTAEQLQPFLDQIEVSGKLPPAATELLPDVGAQLSQQHKLKLPKDALAGLRQLRAVIYLARSTAVHKSVGSVVNLLQITSGFREYIKEEANEIKVDNLRVLLDVSRNPDAWISREEDLTQQEEEAASAAPSGLEQLQLFLQHIALMRDLDDIKDKDKDGQRVRLMTIHASKGLEFKHVFFVGFEDGLVPLVRKQDSETLSSEQLHKDLMEEKRLAYVGCTRAMDSLYLVRAQARGMYGDRRNESKPSRFLHELKRAGVKLKHSRGLP